ncbi:polysaccharide deacetylase 2 family uncharacterized protein YibQ [Rhodoblastus acidophilus]|uniref:divergent polysaccharide deacetylase family protein n=1 Tax=Rhodoblastus acidophilus TaxID=1074 RepID=UPI002224A01E|nr:divergent polysaccharide deacetylase family protein [Rhodoblastus acidophilus]MCW2283222.1 polysaccharide deacetylase 2 family uncharacterized protein YibQ [Rhodoblastus acidophilus]MCW2332082.1 polysaccharide deacetylase 2 family uncharacterized protein YibQ [Rhodoblastus acidophilus]
MLDDLDRPLGLERQEPRVQGGRKPLWAAAALVALALAGGGVWLAGRDGQGRDGFGGEPEARAPIQPLPPAPAAPPVAQVQEQQPEAAPSGARVDIENGVRVVRGGGAAGPAIIHVPDTAASPLPPAPDPRLVEKSRFGLLPKRGKDGATPAQVYARPQAAVKPGVPRIALIVGGMGLNDLATQSAISRLPAAVTLAFAPYGTRVEHLANSARDAGHEILLQAPMEPFDSAESPGPHVISAGDASKAEDELHWQMGRFPGYFGVINYLGGKLASDRDAISPVISEIGKRGLAYIDDGSAPSSVAGEVAARDGLGFLKVDVRIDDVRRPEAIDAALVKLETLAKQKGVAVGFASGLPSTNDRIASYLADLRRAGVVLVPVSAAFDAGDKR